MATRSRIGIQLSDDTILSVYHHWDGYPEGLGMHLVRNYNTYESVAELIDGGDMSTCISEDGKVSYYSATGEDAPPTVSDCLADYLYETDGCGGEYCYLFTQNNEWECYHTIPNTNYYGKPVDLYTLAETAA